MSNFISYMEPSRYYAVTFFCFRPRRPASLVKRLGDRGMTFVPRKIKWKKKRYCWAGMCFYQRSSLFLTFPDFSHARINSFRDSFCVWLVEILIFSYSNRLLQEAKALSIDGDFSTEALYLILHNNVLVFRGLQDAHFPTWERVVLFGSWARCSLKVSQTK